MKGDREMEEGGRTGQERRGGEGRKEIGREGEAERGVLQQQTGRKHPSMLGNLDLQRF